jgi:hypothetical protein
MRSLLPRLTLVMILAVSARAEIVFEHPGFAAHRIAPLIDGTVPQLTAIDSSEYGIGVLTASAQSGIVVVRLIEPSGVIRALATFSESGPGLTVVRLRHDSNSAFDGLVHASLATIPQPPGPQSSAVLVTIQPDGHVMERYRSANPGEGEIYDFDFGIGVNGTDPGLSLLDTNLGNGTRLAILDESYTLNATSANSVPSGRTDTDTQGLRRDSTGRYGGGLLLADTDDSDLVSAVYGLTNVEDGGVYREISSPVPWTGRRYGDLDIVEGGVFGGVAYVTETITNEIQTVEPNGVHTTWATGFVGIDSLAISPDGNSMYVGDLNGIWLIRAAGSEPGPTVLSHDPSTLSGGALTGNPPTSFRVIFHEPVIFADADVAVTNVAGQAVQFDASGSGSQFMIIGLAEPLENDTYTVTISDSVVSAATGQALDGDNDGIAGGDYVFSLTHTGREADLDADGDVDLKDFVRFQAAFSGPLP